MDPSSSSTASTDDSYDGLIASFAGAVDSFERVHVARGVGRDFEMCQIRLDVARLRLTRWAAAAWLLSLAGPQQQRQEGAALRVESVSRTEDLLRSILQAFADAEGASQRSAEGKTELGQSFPHAHDQIERVTLRRRARIVHAAPAADDDNDAQTTNNKWVVDGREHFSELFDGITRAIDGLEELMQPAAVAELPRLCESEIRGMHSMSTIEYFRFAAKDQDRFLSAAFDKWLEARGITQSAEEALWWNPRVTGPGDGSQ